MDNLPDEIRYAPSCKYFSNLKVVKSGTLIEIYQFGRDLSMGKTNTREKTDEEIEVAKKFPKIKASPDEILKASARRSKRMIKRLIRSNSFQWLNLKHKPYLPITLTLTFAENISDIKKANYEFTKFIRRLNYETNDIEKKDLKQSNLKYLAVYELQKRGAIHYHMIFFNLPYIQDVYNRLRDIWGQGRIMVGGKQKNFEKIKDQKKLNKIIEYFTKYIQKSVLENSFPRKKKYITSKNLHKPLQNSFSEVVSLIQSRMPSDSLVYKWDGESEYNKADINETLGKTTNFMRWLNYYQHDLTDYPEIDEYITKVLLGTQ
ncbi:MAG: hypothetical protein Q8Q67_00025 [bacterium]|nr:hypothetical protein [bacterium]